MINTSPWPPFTVQHGSLVVTAYEVASLEFEGPGVHVVAAGVIGNYTAKSGSPYEVGRTLSPTVLAQGGELGDGWVELNGQRVDHVAFAGEIRISGHDVTLTEELLAGGVEVHFTLSAHFECYPATGGFPGSPMAPWPKTPAPVFDVAGKGTLQVTFTKNRGGGPLWTVNRIEYRLGQ